jgi:hypothetical protein
VDPFNDLVVHEELASDSEEEIEYGLHRCMCLLHETAIEKGFSLPFEIGARDAAGCTVSLIRLEDGGNGGLSTEVVVPAEFDLIAVFPITITLQDSSGQNLRAMVDFLPDEGMDETKNVNAAA